LITGLLALVPAQAQEAPRPRVTLSVREADLKDILRAAAHGTDININFEPGVDTIIRGVDLKAVTLEEILEEILPGCGLSYTKQGRTLFIRKGMDSALRFYHVDTLSMRRQGNKSFQVNASGQVMQSGGGGSGGSMMGGGSQSGGGQGQGAQGGGNSSAYTSSVTVGNGSDPWQELEVGLGILVFGRPPEGANPNPQTGSGAGGGIAGPATRGYAKDGKSLVIHPDSGLVVVSADPATHQRVDAYLKEIKRRNSRQVLLEARIVEVSLGNDSQIGVDWNAVIQKGIIAGGTGTDIRGLFGNAVTAEPTSEGAARFIVRGAGVQAALSALAHDGRLEVLSAPRISALNNQKAILRVVREDAYFLQSSQVTPGGTGGNIATVQITPMVVPVGIILDILPQIGDDGIITLAVNPSVSEVVAVRSFKIDGGPASSSASATLPVVDRRDLDTVVRIKSGETLVLAGIIRAKETSDDTGVPWARKIPFLGSLFTKRDKLKSHTELAIFITPTLVEDSEQIATQRESSEKRLEKSGAKLQPEPRSATSIKEP
jgi:MSHA type pilus biogenesis protein MshL